MFPDQEKLLKKHQKWAPNANITTSKFEDTNPDIDERFQIFLFIC